MAKTKAVYFESGEIIEVMRGKHARSTLKRAIKSTLSLHDYQVRYQFSGPFPAEVEAAWRAKHPAPFFR